VQHLAGGEVLIANDGPHRLEPRKLDSPRRASTRLTVDTLRPTSSAIRRIGMRSRRSCSTLRSTTSSRLLRTRLGRELLSASASRPPSRYRSSHFLAVRRLTPAASAAAVSPITGIRSTNNLRPSIVNLAFL
jgi:hypothetical protein